MMASGGSIENDSRIKVDEGMISAWKGMMESMTTDFLEEVLKDEGLIWSPGQREAARQVLEERRRLQKENPEQYKAEMAAMKKRKERKIIKKGRQSKQDVAAFAKSYFSQYLAEWQQRQHQLEEERASIDQELRGSVLEDSWRRLVGRLQVVEREIEKGKGQQELYQRVMKEEEETIQKLILQQDEESKKFLDAAIKQGYVIARIVKCIVEGPAGVGKTSLKFLLLCKKPPTCRTSTGCMEPTRAVSGARIQTLDEGWYELTEDDLVTLLADAIPLLCDQIESEWELPAKVLEALQQLLPDESDEASTDTQEATPTRGPQAEANPTHQEATTPHLEATSTDSPQPEAFPTTKDDRPDTRHQVASSPSTPAKRTTSAVLKKILDRMSSGKEAGKFLRPKLVHFLDSGGQPPFRELFRIFSKRTSVAVLVFRLSEQLDAYPTVEYYDETGCRVGVPHSSPLTNEQMFKMTTRSLQTSPTDGKPPKVIVVGTHKDEEDERLHGTRKEKNEKLYSILHPVMPNELVYYGEALNELIFPMNTKDPGEEEQRIAAILRKEIEKCSNEVVIPIWWYILEMILRLLAKSTNRRVLSRQQCLEVACTLGFSEKQFDAAIKYLDELNIILYYPKILPDAIFMDCQVILDKLSELIKRSYELREAKHGRQVSKSPKATAGKWERFRDLGFIALEFLEEYPHLYVDGLFTPADLVKLLEELLVLAPISRDEHFMPCLLEMLSPAELDKHRVLSGTASPLLLRFPNGWPRCGVFCCLVVFLLSRCQWQVVHPSGAPILVSRNCIKFKLPDHPCVVALIDSFSHFELHVSAPPPICYSICPSIKATILAGMDAASDNLHYNNSKPSVAMFCPHSTDATQVETHTPTPLHAAMVEHYPWWTCTENVSLSGELSDVQKVWYSPARKEGVHQKEGSQKTLESSPVATARKDMSSGGIQEPVQSSSTAATAGVVFKGSHQRNVIQKGLESSPVATIRKDDKPSLLDLVNFPGKHRKFNVMERIGIKYSEFGILLLQDADGSRVSALELTRQRDSNRISCDIMKAWLQGGGKHPVTYATLLGCLRDAGLNSLATDIEDVF